MNHPPLSADQPQRWFSASAITHAVQSLRAEIGRTGGGGRPTRGRPDDTMRLVWGVVVVIGLLLLVLVLVLFLFAPRERQLTPAGAARGIGIIVLVLGGGALATRYYSGVKSVRGREREEAFERLASRSTGFHPGGFAPIKGESVGTIPWLASELDVVVNCNLHGTYRGQSLAMLECTCVLDVTLSKVEASMGKLAAKVMSHIEHEGVQRRTLEAIVFFEPLPLPDLFLAPHDEPLHWYFKKSLRRGGTDVAVLAGPEHWAGTSDANAGARALTPELQRVLRGHPDVIVQVLGGYCVVIPKSWNFNWPTEMPHHEAQLEADLKLARQVYDALSVNALAPVREETLLPAPAPVIDAVGVANQSVRAEPAHVAPARRKPRPRLLGACLGALLLAGLGLAIDVPHLPPENLTFPHLLGKSAFPLMLGAVFGFAVAHSVLRGAWPWALGAGIGGVALIGYGLVTTKKPPEEISFTLVLAYGLIGAVPGALIGWMGGWIWRRVR